MLELNRASTRAAVKMFHNFEVVQYSILLFASVLGFWTLVCAPLIFNTLRIGWEDLKKKNRFKGLQV